MRTRALEQAGGSRLIVVEHDDEPDLEVLHVFHGGDLILTNEDFQARLRRTN